MRKWRKKKQIHTFNRMDNNQKISKFSHQIPQSLVITPESSNVTQRKLILRQDRRDWKQPTFPWRRMSHGLQQAFPLLPRIPCFPIMEWEGLLSRHLTLLPQGYLRGCPSTLDQIWYGPTFFFIQMWSPLGNTINAGDCMVGYCSSVNSFDIMSHELNGYT